MFALGSAVSAAVLAGAHPDSATAQKKMIRLKTGVPYKPKAANEKVYNRLQVLYRQLHDSSGGVNKAADLSQVVKELLDIKSCSLTSWRSALRRGYSTASRPRRGRRLRRSRSHRDAPI